jgi:hypothetical protein
MIRLALISAITIASIAMFLALVARMVIHSSKFINAKCGYLHTISYPAGIRCADPGDCDRCNP